MRSTTVEGAELLTSSAEASIKELNSLFLTLTKAAAAAVQQNDAFQSAKSSKKKNSHNKVYY